MPLGKLQDYPEIVNGAKERMNKYVNRADVGE